MSGIYIHIPFCKKACFYCNFHFSTNTAKIDEMIMAISKEIELRNCYLNDNNIESVYFGGGTPSLLSPVQINHILTKLNSNFNIDPNIEKTIEVNPDDCSKESLQIWADLGFNRLSIGIQSFFDEDLKYMNRAHRSEQSIKSIGNAIEVGFKDISVDLIYGFPLLTNEKWKYNLDKINEYKINHLSCYALTVEQGTPLHKMVMSGKAEKTKDEHQSYHFDLLQEWALQNKWEHYEISNLAKENNYSKHNTSYWRGKHYLGIGPAAHSFDGNSRSWNINDNYSYINLINANGIYFESEILTNESKINEYVLTGIRTIWGINLNEIEKIYPGWTDLNTITLKKLESENLIKFNQTQITLTKLGRHFADGVASDLFLVN